MKTIFCDIDGTLLKHWGDIHENLNKTEILESVIEKLKEWDRKNYKLILTTGRQESTRQRTEQQLLEMGIFYDKLIMGLPNGDRILINDRKPSGSRNTAYAINLVRNDGLQHVDIEYTCLPLEKTEKPWGYEELVEYNDKYVVKKLFMRKTHSCSLQYHCLKTETITVLSGTLTIYIGTDLESLKEIRLQETETITIKPYILHRMSAEIDDCLYLESSTNELWDIKRIHDNYGRIDN